MYNAKFPPLDKWSHGMCSVQYKILQPPSWTVPLHTGLVPFQVRSFVQMSVEARSASIVKPGEHWKLTMLPYVKSLPSRRPFAGTPGSPQLITEYEGVENDGVTTKSTVRELHNYIYLFLHFVLRIEMKCFYWENVYLLYEQVVIQQETPDFSYIDQLYKYKSHLCIICQLINSFRHIFHFLLSQAKASWFVKCQQFRQYLLSLVSSHLWKSESIVPADIMAACDLHYL